MSFDSFFVRASAWALVFACLQPTSAQAQTIEDTTSHQRFACLQRERTLEPLPAKTPELKNDGLVRFKLRFVGAERAPKVELLHNDGDKDMLRIARHYVDGYRLPCLDGKDHPVELVQEFSFKRWGSEPAVQLQSKGRGLSVKLPKEPFRIPGFLAIEPGRILVEFTFDKGREEPEVKVVFNSSNRYMERQVREHVRTYRLQEPETQALPRTGRQEFSFLFDGGSASKFRLKRDEFPLLEFLALTKNYRDTPVDFNLDSMACPFNVRVRLQQPYDSNEVREVGVEQANPNRAYLLDWLSKLELGLPTETLMPHLYGSDVLVQVPCGRLDLTKPSA